MMVHKPRQGPRSGGLAFYAAAFVSTGVLSPMIITEVRVQHKPDAITLWPLYALYLGNLLAGSFGPSVPAQQWFDLTRVFSMDVAGQALAIGGLLLTGPPLFVIVYQAVTIFTGLAAVVFLPPSSHPTLMQWYAMFVITAGLTVQGVDSMQNISLSNPMELRGVAAILVSCVFFAGAACASEIYVAAPGRSGAQPLQAAWVFGVEGCLCAAMWGAFTLRRENTAFLEAPGFLVLFGILVLSNATHQAAWFNLVGSFGACSTAVLKALQSVFLFVSAGLAFCGRDEDQCLTRSKIFSLCIVVVGVLAYSFNSRQAQAFANERAAAAGLKIPATETSKLRNDV